MISLAEGATVMERHAVDLGLVCDETKGTGRALWSPTLCSLVAPGSSSVRPGDMGLWEVLGHASSEAFSCAPLLPPDPPRQAGVYAYDPELKKVDTSRPRVLGEGGEEGRLFYLGPRITSPNVQERDPRKSLA